jgi:membrane-associated phospholipid phosphatase
MVATVGQGVLVAVAGDILWNPSPIIAVQRVFGPGWLPVFQVITSFGTGSVALVALALVFWLSGRQLLYGLFLVILVSALIGTILKTAVGLPRPHDPRIVVRAEAVTPSFPSGHALTATTLWGMLAARRQVPLLVPFLIVPLVMLSRMYLGVHYLGDVLGGALIGLALVLLAQRLWLPARDWLAGRTFHFFVLTSTLILVVLIASLPFLGASTEDWHTIGAGGGGVIGLLLEYRYLRYTPPVSTTPGRQMLLVALGLSLLVLPLIVVWFLGGGPPVQAASYALAALWATFGAPALFIRLGQAKTRFPRSSAGAGWPV